jgi:ADP-ribose pyrophosphatase YjhB (NUDIX family)
MMTPMKFCPSCGGDVSYSVPDGDNRERAICNACGTTHYQNPLIVVGCIVSHGDKVLLCKRAIEPRYGYWTVPAGFMELNETTAEGAARETREEALAEVKLGRLFAAVDIVRVGQLHMYYLADLEGSFGAGAESLETRLFSEDEIPWDDIAFLSGKYALRKFFEDGGKDNGVHVHAFGADD